METDATPVNEWRGRKGTPLELPSGNTALVRNPGIQHFLKTGQIPNSLRSMIQKAMNSGDKAPEKLQTIFENEEEMAELFDLFDKVILQVVIEPKVLPVPVDEDGMELHMNDRDLEAGIYVDEVNLEDKAFIFQYAVGGTKDLERFREGQKTTMEHLSTS